MKEQYWKYSLIIFIIGLGMLLFRQAQPFMNGILGGFTLYILLRNFSNWLQTKIKPLLAVWMITIGVTLFILIPVSLFSWAIVSQISGMHFDIRPLSSRLIRLLTSSKNVRVSICYRRKVCHLWLYRHRLLAENHDRCK